MNPITDFIKSAASSAGKGLLDGVKGVLGTFITDPTAKLEAETKLKELELAHEEKMAELANAVEDMRSKEAQNEDNNVSDRWKADMTSDNALSKNTRPIIVLSLLAFLFIVITLDSSIKDNFDVKPAYIDLMSTLLVTTIVAYFGSRGIEKFKALHEMKNN